MKKVYFSVALLLSLHAMIHADTPIQPSPANPRYWEFRGRTVPLLGGSSEDNLFQIEDLEAELRALAAAGGSYVRCSMSSRDPGNVWPFARDPSNGLYDLSRFNPEYWNRFESLIRLADELNIVVQIEVFDRFDYFRKEWKENPFNPHNTLSYDAESSGLGNDYPQHPNAATNPFFRTVPALDDNPVVRQFQEAFVSKILEITLPRGNVLYCISNETKEQAAWGAYWAGFIHAAAEAAGTRACVTEMWDARDLTHEDHKRTWGHPELYDFVDISQVNHQTGQTHWDQLIAFRKTIAETGHPRPLTTVKIYGANSGYYGTTRDGLERFWRNLFAGLAAVRFHRPDSGLGHRGIALQTLRSARALLDKIDLTLCSPDAVMIHNRSANEAYGTGSPAAGYAVFFPDGGNILLRTLDPQPGIPFTLSWLNLSTAEWQPAGEILLDAQSETRLITPTESGYWIALLTPPQFSSPATTPTEQDHWLKKHQRYCQLGLETPVDLLFIGDSITEQWLWGETAAIWNDSFSAWHPANMGIGGDRTEHLLWRIENSTLAHVRPRVVVLMVGTNNLWRDPDADIAAGIEACVRAIKAKLPDTHILLLGLLPRSEQPDHPVRARIRNINTLIAPLGRLDGVSYHDLGPHFLEPDGTLSRTIMHDSLHLTPAGYRRWADVLQPILAPHFS